MAAKPPATTQGPDAVPGLAKATPSSVSIDREAESLPLPDPPPRPPSSSEAASPSAALPAVLTADELAALLRLDRKTVYAAIQRREIPGVRRVGSCLRVSRDAVLRWLEEGRGPAPAAGAPGATLRSGQAGVSRARKGDAR